MAREHARILCSIWRPGDDFRDRSPDAQRLYFLVLSQRELNNAGVIPLMVSKWARCSAGTTVADIEKALAELAEHRYVVVDHETDEVLVRTFIRNDGIAKQPNMLKSALRSARQIESPMLRVELARELVRLGHPDAFETAAEIAPEFTGEAIAEPSSSPSANPSPNPVEEPLAKSSSTSEKNPSVRPAGWGGGGEGGGASRSGGGPGGNAQARPPRPAARCKQHADDEDPPPCGRCAAARRNAERWDAEQAEAEAAERAASRAAVEACSDCDENGMREFAGLGLGRCTHPSLAAAVPS